MSERAYRFFCRLLQAAFTMRGMRTVLALLVAALPTAALAQWTVDAQLARTYDDNLSRAQRKSDIVRDHALALRGGLGRTFVVADGDLVLRGEARAARYDDVLGLDHAAAGAGASWRRKLGLGLTAPWLAADAAMFLEDHATAVRDGRSAALSLELGKRFGPRFDASLSALYDRRRQRDDFPTVPGFSGEPFSLQGRSLALQARYALHEKLLAFGAFAARRGDVVSSTRRNPQIFGESAAIAPDPAFGPDFIAYKLTGAETASATLGLSWALGAMASLDVALATDRTRARGGLDYDGNVYSLSLVYRD
jgi:hypothetical protein